MKKKITFQIIGCFFILLFLSGNLFAQRPMERLGRGLIARKVSNGVYVNWRITSDEWYNTSYKLYRNGTLIHETGTDGASNYLDASGSTGAAYTVTAVKNGVESIPSAQVIPTLTADYFDIPMRQLPAGKTGYTLNDATAADLDGDGEYEIIVKRINKDWSIENTNYSYFEAYKLDGTFLWSIDVGPNIMDDVEINIAAFDLDGDGKAEVFMRTSEGTIFGDGTKIGDINKDGRTNYRAGWSQYIFEGPEFLSLIDGETGKEIDRVDFIPRTFNGRSFEDIWGAADGGHRCSKYFFGAPYLDGEKPSLFIGRGIYTRTVMRTYDVVNKKLAFRWEFNTDDPGNGSYAYKGNHNYTIADVDGDGRDEIVWGQMCVDDNGKGLYATNHGHGDAMHVGDLDPYRKGIEVFSCLEGAPEYGVLFRDGKSGETLLHYIRGKDCGRCCAANITDSYKGAELWGGGIGYSTGNQAIVNHFGTAENYVIYWDGDLLREMCDHSNFTEARGTGDGNIYKFYGYGDVRPLLQADALSCNYTKGTPCLQADLFGDWREEVIWRRPDDAALRVYITPYETTQRIYTLMHDHQYRQAICWQMCGYNQPPHLSYYLGSEFPTPIPAKSTNGKLVWKGTSGDWSTSAANFMDGDDVEGLVKATASPVSFANGKSVLFDTRGVTKSVNISANIEPELLMVSGTVDYEFGGTGSLSGSMRLDKLGEGTMKLSGTHPYSGTTDIWEGYMEANAILTNSQVMIRRHAEFGGKGTYHKGVLTEYNASIYIGGKGSAGTTTIKEKIDLVEGARLVFDLSGDLNSGNDFMQLNGTLNIANKSVVCIEKMTNLAVGTYVLATINELTGDLSKVKIEGVTGIPVKLEYDDSSKELRLIVREVRAASDINWTGDVDGTWDLATTFNWENAGNEDFYVTGDRIYFDKASIKAQSRTLTLSEDLMPGYVEFNSTQDYSLNDGSYALTGTMELLKKNTGKLTLNNKNSYTGKTVIEGGTLVLKYLPTAAYNGGIGANTTDPSLLELKNGGALQVSVGGQITSRGLTLSGETGGIFNLTESVIWDGEIKGTKLVKNGTGALLIGNKNSNLTETVLNAGTLKLNSVDAINGIGSKITLNGGTLETINANGAYLYSGHTIDVPAGKTATVIAAARCEYNGTLTGSGTLNWVCDFIRAYINGNWSGFTGTINVTANSANPSYGDDFSLNNSGLPGATVNLGNGVVMYHKTGGTIKLGLLSGVIGSTFTGSNLEVGSSNKNGAFAGAITGSGTIKKVGTGTWALSGSNTYTGNTTVSEGNLIVNGGLGGTAITIADGAGMTLNNSKVGGTVTVQKGGTLSLSGGTLSRTLTSSGTLTGTGTVTGNATLGANSLVAPGGSSTGTLNFSGKVTISDATATLDMQIIGGDTKCDKIDVVNELTCNGKLNVTCLRGTLAKGNSYTLFTASEIIGAFTEINLPKLESGLYWDTSKLYSEGTIEVTDVPTGINTPVINTGLLANPTTGIFEVAVEPSNGNFSIVVVDSQGEVIYQAVKSTENRILTIDIVSQPAGVYLLTILSSDKLLSNTLKLIKQ